MGALLGRLAGWLLRLVAGTLILLAVVVGAARLMLPLVPQYLEQVRSFTGASTGLVIDFEGISASWPLSGPELRFLDVQFGLVDQPELLVVARELRLGFGIRELLFGRQLVPTRVLATGVALDFERLAATGQVRINGAVLDWPLELPESGRRRIERLALDLRDIELRVADQRRLVPEFRLVIGRLSAALEGDVLELAAAAALPEELGRTLDLSGSLPLNLLLASADPAPRDWTLQLRATGLALAQLLRAAADMDTPVLAGRLDLVARAEGTGRSPREFSIEPALRNLELSQDGERLPAWDELGASLRWTATDGGWQLAADRLRVVRAGQAWPAGPLRLESRQLEGDRRQLAGRLGFLRLDDLYPLLPALASTRLRGQLPGVLRGELREIEFSAELGGGREPDWQAALAFSGLGFTLPAREPPAQPGLAREVVAAGIDLRGLSGSLRGGSRGGQLEIDSREPRLALPGFFQETLQVSLASGLFSWRAGPRGIVVSSDNLMLAAPGVTARATISVDLPPQGLPLVALDAEVEAPVARDVLPFLPVRGIPPVALRWLDEAILAGQLSPGRIAWRGPPQGFPYPDGGGSFVFEMDVADGQLDYQQGWPRLSEVEGTVVIDGIRLYTRGNRGRIGGIAFADANVRIDDLRNPELVIDAAGRLTAVELLRFLRASPLRATLGPTLAVVEARGTLVADLGLRLPLRRAQDYRLASRIGIRDGELWLGNFEPRLDAISGEVRLDNTRLVAAGISASFLGATVTIDLRSADPAAEPGFGQVAEARGVTAAGEVAAAFSLPWASYLDGSLDWSATILFPDAGPGAPADAERLPVTFQVASDLAGFASRLPPPLDKRAAASERLALAVELPQGADQAIVRASLARGIHAALRLARADNERWSLQAGHVRAGMQPPALPVAPGLELSGRLAAARFEDWVPGPGADTGDEEDQPTAAMLRTVDLRVDRLEFLGRDFADVSVEARQRAAGWQVQVEAPAVAGTIAIPAAVGNELPMRVDLARLWLGEPPAGEGEEGPDTDGDPRRTLPADIAIGDFRLGDMQLGTVEARARQVPAGIMVEPLTATGASFRIEGSADWLLENGDLARQRTALRLALDSTNAAATLAALGYGPVIEGSRARLTLDLGWRGGPGQNPAIVGAGDVGIAIDRGQLLQVEPGGGRFLGLLSVGALPKRLALDFRDVLDKGLTFDELRGDFRLEGGNAWTCNLGLTGSVTDLALVGRVGLRDRDYDQLAVVRPNVSEALALGGAVIAGPGVGVTMLLLSQIFRKPLSALGEAYYRIDGSWDQPAVNRVQRAEVDMTRFRDCERYLAEVLPELVPPAGGETTGEDGAKQ